MNARHWNDLRKSNLIKRIKIYVNMKSLLNVNTKGRWNKRPERQQIRLQLSYFQNCN